jgi:glycosyltransferase involved in cell wall biosynthesis
MISVVIPAFRARDTIGRALESVRGQTHRDWEILVAEDGEGDGTRSLVAAFAATITQTLVYVPLGGHRGTSAARNAALDRCRGDMVAFLDADDEWAPTHLATLAACVDDGHALAVSAVEIWDDVTDRRVAIHGMHPAWLAAPRDALFMASIIFTASCVATPRATIERVGRFDSALPIGEDRDYWFRAVAAGGSIGFTEACTVRYHRHQANSTHDPRVVLASIGRFHEKHRDAADVSHEAQRRARARVLAARRALGDLDGSPCP